LPNFFETFASIPDEPIAVNLVVSDYPPNISISNGYNLIMPPKKGWLTHAIMSWVRMGKYSINREIYACNNGIIIIFMSVNNRKSCILLEMKVQIA
jgi:hypothetical protein